MWADTWHRYICQYVEVRQTTPPHAAHWLLIQGLLALICVAIWIWDPTFDDFTMEKDSNVYQRVHFSEAQLVMLWYTQIYPIRRPIPPPWQSKVWSHRTEIPVSHEKMQEKAAYPPNWIRWDVPNELRIPTWALEALDLATRDVSSMFDLARRLREGGPTWQEDVDTFRSAELFCDIPGWLFMLWVDAHTEENYLCEPNDEKRFWNAYNCRIIRVGAKKFHFLPYWTSCRHYVGGTDFHQFITDMDEGKNHRKKAKTYKFGVFGHPGHMDSLIWSCNCIDQRDAGLPRQQELVVGWPEEEQMPPLFQRLNIKSFQYFLPAIEELTREMWRKIDFIFDESRLHFRYF